VTQRPEILQGPLVIADTVAYDAPVEASRQEVGVGPVGEHLRSIRIEPDRWSAKAAAHGIESRVVPMPGNGPGKNGQYLLQGPLRLMSKCDADLGLRVEFRVGSGVGAVYTVMGTAGCDWY